MTICLTFGILDVMSGAIQYREPTSWIKYDKDAIQDNLLAAKASIMALRAIPFQRRWVKELQEIQLKMEVAGTSQIEGADFAANELDTAIKAETPEQLLTRSQRQANAAVRTYRKIAEVPDDRPISTVLIKYIHASIVTGCDDDHCAPGVIRRADHNVTFGVPKHRGVTGGKNCETALDRLTEELATTFRSHDPLIQALALHYHFAAMHPFSDGNGRDSTCSGSFDVTARWTQGCVVHCNVELLLRRKTRLFSRLVGSASAGPRLDLIFEVCSPRDRLAGLPLDHHAQECGVQRAVQESHERVVRAAGKHTKTCDRQTSTNAAQPTT